MPIVEATVSPAPNLIISLDDSGSMQSDDVTAIRNTLTQLINDETLFPDDSIRLGWNSMNRCPTIGYNTDCDNGIRRLDSSQRNRFTSWLNDSRSGYYASGGTPSHRALWNTGAFLMEPIPAAGTSARHNSPWVANPGATDSANQEEPLNCRRNYVVFFTDGGFNVYSNSEDYHGIRNYDGQTRSLPDGTLYDTSSNQTKIYRDSASSAITHRSNYSTYYSWVSSGTAWSRVNYETTLSDIAFYFWANPLQSGWTNVLQADYKVNADETHTGASGTTIALDKYWNPKNNPATWSHINFFTIGYNAASDWRYKSASSSDPSFLYSPDWQKWHGRDTLAHPNPPEFDWAGDIDTATWTGRDYSSLITGDLEWIDPLKTILSGEPTTNGTETTSSQCSTSYYSPFNTGIYKTDNSTFCGNGDRSPQRGGDLWHAALNSRGRFVPAPDANDLADAFRSILSGLQIGGEIQYSYSAPAGTSSSAFSTDSRIFAASFDPEGWQGHVKMYEITYTYSGGYTTGTATATATIANGWGSSSAADILARTLSTSSGLNNRFVMMKGVDDTGAVEGKLFRLNDSEDPCDLDTVFANFPDDHRNGIFSGDTSAPSATTCQNVMDKINYIRGDQSNEIENGGPLRDRSSLIGDIVNSNIWFTPSAPTSDYYEYSYYNWRAGSISSRRAMIYVGANDGMLHGFRADDGEEKIAYIPSAFLIQPNGTGTATIMTTPNENYVHRYYADGPVFTADLNINSSDSGWKTYLAGALGAGGKGYYILDVTDPGNFSANRVGDLLIADTTDGMAMAPAHADYIGHIFGEPVREQGNTAISRQITKINYSPSTTTDAWAFLTHNGYNSENETPALFVHILSTSQKNTILRLDVDCGGNTSCLSTVSTSNGLSTPRLIDLNGDNVPDVAYAGDLQGNVWRFDLSSTSTGNWNSSIKGKRIFTATDSRGNPQPITSAPVWAAHPNGGVMLAFGTGRLLTTADRTDSQTQTIYGIYDSTPITRTTSQKGGISFGEAPSAITRSDLVRQEMSALGVSTSDGGDALWSVTSNAVDYTGGDRGWYLDLEDDRERVIENLEWFDGNLIHIYSQVPATSSGDSSTGESCSVVSVASGKSYRTTISIINGNAPTSTIFNYTAPTGADNAARIEYVQGFVVSDSANQYNLCPGGNCSLNPSSTSATKRLARVAVEPSWIQVR